MIYETDVPGWPYRIMVDREGDTALSVAGFYEFGKNELVEFNEKWDSRAIVRWEFAIDNRTEKWWFYVRSEEQAVRMLTIIGGI